MRLRDDQVPLIFIPSNLITRFIIWNCVVST